MSFLWTQINQFFVGLWAKFAGIMIAIGAALIAFFAFRAKYRAEGRAEIKQKVQEKKNEVDKKWNEIDRKPADPSDFDRKLDSL